MAVLEGICFFVAAIFAVGGAVGVVMLRNPFFSVLALVMHLLALAALFLLLHAEFLAASQIIVYAGAVMVLYVFVAAYVGNVEEPIAPSGPLVSLAPSSPPPCSSSWCRGARQRPHPDQAPRAPRSSPASAARPSSASCCSRAS